MALWAYRACALQVSAGVKEQFTAVAAAHGLAFGELLERALDAFVREEERAQER